MNDKPPKPTTIDEYITAFPSEIQAILEQIRHNIRQAAPQAQEAISYQMPTFKLHGNLVHFAAYKNHIGFYPAPKSIEQFKYKLSDYKSSKGAIQFPLDQAIPFDLIREIVAFSVLENTAPKNKK